MFLNGVEVPLYRFEQFLIKVFQRITFNGFVLEMPSSIYESGYLPTRVYSWNGDLDDHWLFNPLFRVIDMYPESLSLRKLEICGCDNQEQMALTQKLIDTYGILRVR